MNKYIITAGIFLCLISGLKADFTRKMVCRWTFNGTDKDKALVDDVSGVELTRTGTGRDQTLSIKNGVAEVGAGTLLKACDINSDNEKFAALKDKITIWARLKFMSKPHGFFIGLLNADKPADWAQQVFTSHVTNKTQFRLFGTNMTGKHFGVGNKWTFPPDHDFINIAITYDRSKKSYSIIIDGKKGKGKNSIAAELGKFQCFSIGRLKKHVATKLIIDEVRIYSMVVPNEWLNEIETVE